MFTKSFIKCSANYIAQFINISKVAFLSLLHNLLLLSSLSSDASGVIFSWISSMNFFRTAIRDAVTKKRLLIKSNNLKWTEKEFTIILLIIVPHGGQKIPNHEKTITKEVYNNLRIDTLGGTVINLCFGTLCFFNSS